VPDAIGQAPAGLAVGIDSFISFTLALLALLAGKQIVARLEVLRRNSIPEALVGGVLCAAIVGAVYYAADIAVAFDLPARDLLLLYFFASIGLNTDVRTLASGGRPLVILAVLSIGFMVLQNGVGMSVAGAFGMDPRAGLMVGSISLTGGVGTTVAWTPHFTQVLGIAGAGELGLSANMIGMVAACSIGGPIAAMLIRRHRVAPSGDAALDVDHAVVARRQAVVERRRGALGRRFGGGIGAGVGSHGDLVVPVPAGGSLYPHSRSD